MSLFEYKVLDVPAKGFWRRKIDLQQLAYTLNDLGRRGWEVVSATDTSMYQGTTRGVIILLKRQIENP